MISMDFAVVAKHSTDLEGIRVPSAPEIMYV